VNDRLRPGHGSGDGGAICNVTKVLDNTEAAGPPLEHSHDVTSMA